MPKNKGKGGKNRRRGKNENDADKRELVFREDGQEYAQVVKMLGNGRLEAQCFDGEKRLAHIRGKMRKKVSLIFPTISGSGGSTIGKVWINQGDIILLSLREFQDDKADVIVKYTADEARNLKAYGELPDTVKINETDTFGEEDGECTFEFGDEGEVDVDDI
ncbi:Eukaryotic translation initiation factor 1A, partial [Rhizoctonia solani]